MNGFVIGDALSGTVLFTMPLAPAFGIPSLAGTSKTGSPVGSSGGGANVDDKVCAASLAAFAFTFLHKSDDISNAAVQDGTTTSTTAAWRSLDVKAATFPEALLRITTTPPATADMTAFGALEEMTRRVPPNAAPVPHIQQSNGSALVTMALYRHPFVPIFVVAVDAQERDDDVQASADGHGAGLATAAAVAAVCANRFLAQHGGDVIESLQRRTPLKPKDAKAIRKVFMTSVKAMYQEVVRALIVDALSAVLRRAAPVLARSSGGSDRTTASPPPNDAAWLSASSSFVLYFSSALHQRNGSKEQNSAKAVTADGAPIRPLILALRPRLVRTAIMGNISGASSYVCAPCTAHSARFTELEVARANQTLRIALRRQLVLREASVVPIYSDTPQALVVLGSQSDGRALRAVSSAGAAAASVSTVADALEERHFVIEFCATSNFYLLCRLNLVDPTQGVQIGKRHGDSLVAVALERFMSALPSLTASWHRALEVLASNGLAL